MTPHWSNYGILFSNDLILSNDPVDISPYQAHGKGAPHSQKLWVCQQFYNHLQNSIALEDPA